MRYQLLFGVTSAATALALGTPAYGAAMTRSDIAPLTASITQSDFSAPAFNGAQDFSDNAGPPAQAFTTDAAIVLSSITVKGFADTPASFGGGVNTGTWTVTVSRVDFPVGTVSSLGGPLASLTDLVQGGFLTQLGQETLNPSAATDGDAYYTITLDTPIPLAAGGIYAYDIYSSTGWFGFAKSATDVYAGGDAFQHGSTSRTAADGAAATNVQSTDRTFFINAAPVPEPGSAAALLLAGAAAAFGRRRGRR